MNKIVTIVLCCLLTISIFNTYAQENNDDWVQLFNGKDLTGWTPKITGYPAGENFGNTFYVEDGLMKVSFDAYDKFDGKFGHIFYEKPFSNYIIRVE